MFFTVAVPVVDGAAARPDRDRLVPDGRHLNPVSYLLEGIRCLFIKGWDAEALALGFGFAAAIGGHGARGGVHAADEDGAHMSRALITSARGGVAQPPQLLHQPGAARSRALFPLFFFTAFAGGLSRVSEHRASTSAGYTAFQFSFVLLQASAFGGVFTGFSMARDFESGFRGG